MRKVLMLTMGILLMVPALAMARNIYLMNKMSVTVWAGWQGSTIPNGGGVAIAPGATYTLVVPDNWTAARVWGRTGCSFNSSGVGTCETGDCGNKLACAGAGGIPPATLSEWTLQGYGGLDYYDVSLVDGYNLPMVLQNVGGKKSGNGTKYDCGVAGCTSDLNKTCPTALQLKNSAGTVVACYSACEKFQTDQYCCRNAYGTPATCPPTTYSQTFKAACPDAYSYAYDDDSSTFTCIGGNYNVIFGTTSTSSTSSSGATPTPTATPTATKTPTPTPTPTATPSGTVVSVPGVISSSVGAIANGATKTWTVNCTSAGNYRTKITLAGIVNSRSFQMTFAGQTWTLSGNPGQVILVDKANLTAGNKTFSIKATSASLVIGKVEMVKY